MTMVAPVHIRFVPRVGQAFVFQLISARFWGERRKEGVTVTFYQAMIARRPKFGL